MEESWTVFSTPRGAARTGKSGSSELARQVAVCTKCDLALNRTNTVFGTGDPYSPLMLVGEGPGENEDATGLPFVGQGRQAPRRHPGGGGPDPAADLPDQHRQVPGRDRGGRQDEEPPAQDQRDQGLQPLPAGPDRGRKAGDILCLGGPAAKTIIDKDFRITKDRGQWYDLEGGVKAMATFHPAYVLQSARRRPAEHQASGLEGYPGRLRRVPEGHGGAGIGAEGAPGSGRTAVNIVKNFIPDSGYACYHCRHAVANRREGLCKAW